MVWHFGGLLPSDDKGSRKKCILGVDKCEIQLNRVAIYVTILTNTADNDPYGKFSHLSLQSLSSSCDKIPPPKPSSPFLPPLQAEFFLVPIYGECYLWRAVQQLGSKAAITNTNTWFLSALDHIMNDLPYWNRTQGRDHLWVFPGARGPHIFKDWKKHIRWVSTKVCLVVFGIVLTSVGSTL